MRDNYCGSHSKCLMANTLKWGLIFFPSRWLQKDKGLNTCMFSKIVNKEDREDNKQNLSSFIVLHETNFWIKFEAGADHFSLMTSNSTQGQSMMLFRARFRLDITKMFFIQKEAGHWPGFPGKRGVGSGEPNKVWKVFGQCS